jgi:hypothetical protein
MTLRELEHDTASSDGRERASEGLQVADVVQDVPGDRHVHRIDKGRDVGPSAVERLSADAGRAGVREEPLEHVLLRIHADQHAPAAGQGE